MLKNYFKLAYRSLLKNKTFSAINIFGLAIGLTCCLLIVLYLYKEFSYDTHHQLRGRLYQVGTLSMKDGREERSANTPAPMAPAMQQDFPEVESSTRLMRAFQDDKTLLQYQEGTKLQSFYEEGGFLADSNFFRLLSYPFIEGAPATALEAPNSLVLSEEIARKIFGSGPALNKTIHINSNTNGVYDFRVTGVFRPSTVPTHINARFFMSMRGGDVYPWVQGMTSMANNNLFYTYLALKPGADAKKLESKFAAFIDRHAGAELKASGRNRAQFLTPVEDVHLYAPDGNVSAGGSLSYLYILLSIAFVTLLIACVNFMNLSTARSSKRALEIGVRKVLGAERRSLVYQFLSEAVLLSTIAFLLSLAIAFLLMPLFEKIAGKEFYFSAREYFLLGGAFFLLSLLAGVVAGIYPAFYLSAFQPIRVLKGKAGNSLAAISLRKVLVVFQFVIAVALIVASLTIGNQMRYLRTKDLGFRKDQQIVIPLRTTTAKEIYPALKDELRNMASVAAAGASFYYPGIPNVTDWLLYRQGNPPEQTVDVFMNRIDNSYLQTMGVQLVAGRLFSPDFPGDTANRVVLNEQAVRAFGFASPQAAIGKSIAANFGQETLFSIVGVVKDFHFQGLHEHIKSYGFLLNRRPSFDYLVAHANGGNIKAALGQITTAWNRLNPNEPFEYSFLDQDFQKNYEAEERLAAIIRYFTLIAIFISCLGLFGLTAFSVEQRTKEIGIRKVLGASVGGIVGLLSKDFLRLVTISFLIATPLAWYFIHRWLEGFAYRTPFSLWLILAGCGTALLIAFFTISLQAVRAALSNPVKSLRAE